MKWFRFYKTTSLILRVKEDHIINFCLINIIY